MSRQKGREHLLSCLPEAAAYLTPMTREIRVRAGQPMTLIEPRGPVMTRWIPDGEAVTLAVEALTGRSLHARREEAARGALSLPGGHRLGLCGQMGPGGFTRISGFCLRIAGQWPGTGDGVIQRLKGRAASLLVIGPPSSGKTTLIRDLCRQWSLRGVQTVLLDERGELAGLYEGVPQLDVGPMTDVLAGAGRAGGLYQAIRSLSPQMLITDEVGPEEAQALREALLCGVRVCASAHGASLEDVRRRPGLGDMVREGLFEGYVLLQERRMIALYDREGKEWA